MRLYYMISVDYANYPVPKLSWNVSSKVHWDHNILIYSYWVDHSHHNGDKQYW